MFVKSLLTSVRKGMVLRTMSRADHDQTDETDPKRFQRGGIHRVR